MTTVAESTPRERRVTFLNDLANLFSDFWFGMGLLAIWGVMTTIGVVFDQGKDANAYYAEYGPPLARLILRLHLDNIYHSVAYVGMIGLILAAMTFATFRNVIPRRIPALRPVKIEYIPLHAYVTVAGSIDEIRERVAGFFAERGWTIRKREFGGEEWTFADKYNWARYGVIVAHIGFVFIAAGTTVYWAHGFSGTTAIVTGQTQTIPETGARIRLNSFAYQFDPIVTKAGLVYQPIDYVSHVTITGKDGTPRAMTIRVNQPVNVDGTDYYQSTYGFAISFRLTKNGALVTNSPAQPLREGEGFVIDGQRAIQYTQFIGTIDRRTGAAKADPRPNDPGVVIAAFDGDRLAGRALIPLGTSIDLGGGYSLTAQRYTLYSGFQYRYDPGVLLVGIGAFILVAGLCIAFYFVPARLYVRVTGEGNEARVGIAATSVKGYDLFEERFGELITALRARIPEFRP